jgi:putative MFS transporter
MTSALRHSEHVNIPDRLERLPLTAYQKRLFVIVATAWLADQVDVALLVFLIGDLKNYFDLNPGSGRLSRFDDVSRSTHRQPSYRLDL